MEKSARIIKYLDLFGTRCTFYNDKMPKLYTVVGGILSIISILVCIIIFIIFSLDDIKRKFPNTTISSIPSERYKKIKFGEEKIWIPWRIVDYNNNEFVNHTGILYPIISYISGQKIKNSKDFNLTKKLLKYKLCNETSMINGNNIYQISVPLNELYCIDTEDLDMGGSWMSEFINYIEFDLYYCEDGINFNESNSKCSTFEKIINFIGEKNSLDISIYFPVVQFQPINKTNPIIVIYRQFYYHLSKYAYKINRIFLQENVFTDDSGWILKNEKNNSYWGMNSFSGDTYFNGKENDNDIMNEGSNSRAYSFNIYLESGIIHYKRHYKKIHTIFSDFFPMAFIIFVVMKKISKLFKSAEGNQRMIELLFENLKEKPNVFKKNIQKLRLRNYNSINNFGRLSFQSFVNKIKAENKSRNANETNGINNVENEEDNDSYEINVDKVLNNNDNTIKKPIQSSHQSSLKLNIFQNHLNNNNNNKNNISKAPNSNSKINSKFNNSQKPPFINYLNNTSNQNLLPLAHKFKSNMYLEKANNNQNDLKFNQLNKQKQYIKEKLFPYKYYLFSVFIKNLQVSNDNCFFSSKFAKIYTFLCQLFDIATYLSFQREFNALKTIFNEKSIQLIEKNQKININSNSFLKDINQCIGEEKFYILAQGLNNKK